MKFIISKKITDNRAVYTSVLWMVGFLLIAMFLGLVSKGIDFGTTPAQWVNTVLGNEAEFIDPLTIKDILLTLHTELFGFTFIFVLINALLMRTSRSKSLKMALLLSEITALLLYPLGLLAALSIGSSAILLSWGAFILFHLLLIGSATDILILLFRKRF